jgi:hypothetical protein
VVAGISHPHANSALTYIIDRPLDILSTLDQLATLTEDPGSELAGLMNVNQTGVMGYNDGAYTSLAVSGARVDTEAASHYADLVDATTLRSYYSDWDWTTMAAYHDQLMPPESGDPLWLPMTDPRIRAVVPYMVCEVHVLGERGLAAATVPTLLIGGTANGTCTYDWDVVPAYVNLGSAERYLLTLVGAGMAIPTSNQTEPVVQQFVTAFFGYYLQGKAEYADYLTEDYAESLDDVVWGIDEIAANKPYFSREVMFLEGGTAAVGDVIVGEIPDVGNRVEYSLTLDADAPVNFYARATGTATNDESGAAFDPVLYVRDAQGEVLVWNDDFTVTYRDKHDDLANFDAGLEGLTLPAGSYTIIVNGYGRSTGRYELVVESAD